MRSLRLWQSWNYFWSNYYCAVFQQAIPIETNLYRDETIVVPWFSSTIPEIRWICAGGKRYTVRNDRIWGGVRSDLLWCYGIVRRWYVEGRKFGTSAACEVENRLSGDVRRCKQWVSISESEMLLKWSQDAIRLHYYTNNTHATTNIRLLKVVTHCQHNRNDYCWSGLGWWEFPCFRIGDVCTMAEWITDVLGVKHGEHW